MIPRPYFRYYHTVDRIGLLDSGFLYLESPESPMHVAGLNLFRFPPRVHERKFMSRIDETYRSADELRKPFGHRVTHGMLGRFGPLYWEPDPDIDLVAQREITAEDVIVSISVRGRLADPFVTLSSQPSMPSNEALSYLLTGRSINSLQSNEASSVNQAANDLAISGGALLLGGIGQRVGLDDVTVERGSNDQTEVVLGKALSPRLYVSYGISIAEAINTIKLRYTINENWSGIIEAGLNQAADLEYRVER